MHTIYLLDGSVLNGIRISFKLTFPKKSTFEFTILVLMMTIIQFCLAFPEIYACFVASSKGFCWWETLTHVISGEQQQQQIYIYIYIFFFNKVSISVESSKQLFPPSRMFLLLSYCFCFSIPSPLWKRGSEPTDTSWISSNLSHLSTGWLAGLFWCEQFSSVCIGPS